MQTFATAINEVRNAKDVILVVTKNVYGSTVGDSARDVIFDMGIRNLVYAHNKITSYLNEGNALDADTFPVKSFPSVFKDYAEYLNQLDLVTAWLDDPFLFDSRKEYRDAALVNLRKAQMVLMSVIERVSNPR